MGFWDGVGKLLGGKPVFDENGNNDQHRDEPKLVNSHTEFRDVHGNKIVPEVAFKNFKAHVNGNTVMSWAWATNISKFELELEKLELLGKHYHIGRRLKPGEGHEIKVYDGPVIKTDHDTRARLYFTIHENDDLFLAEYFIEFNREHDGTYTLEEFHRDHQPRDI